ncbi:MAG: hypothetical protein ACI9OJ_000847 [Myxococcota bacterium]|jgi:hypothetical protein
MISIPHWSRTLVAILLLAALGCERRPDSGARVAEPDEGDWVWLCAAEVVGPERTEKRGSGTATHIQRAQARRLAIAAACATISGGAPCSAQTADWAIENEECTNNVPTVDDADEDADGDTRASDTKDGPKDLVKPKPGKSEPSKKKLDQRTTHRCSLEVVRAAGERNHRAQTEGRNAQKACIRAQREACRHLNGGPACEAGREPWVIRTSVGRHRPLLR